MNGFFFKTRGKTVAGAEAKKKLRRETQMRQVGDIMRKLNAFIFLTCVCGLKLKIPPNYKSDKVRCPRCKRILSLTKNETTPEPR